MWRVLIKTDVITLFISSGKKWLQGDPYAVVQQQTGPGLPGEVPMAGPPSKQRLSNASNTSAVVVFFFFFFFLESALFM